jgi:hypothetical protein
MLLCLVVLEINFAGAFPALILAGGGLGHFGVTWSFGDFGEVWGFGDIWKGLDNLEGGLGNLRKLLSGLVSQIGLLKLTLNAILIIDG